MSKIQNKINKSGIDGQTWLRNILNYNGIKDFIEESGGNKSQIDFQIKCPNGDILYVDPTNQNGSGSVGEKIPHKVWKYYKLYDYKKVHILMGKYDIPTKNPSVVKHCQEEYGERFETIFITRDEMILLLEKIFDIKINMPPEMIQGTMQEFE